ncbi:MAG: M12 family metallo-peptidase [Verrucomicrobiales bacterium]
MLGPAEAGAGAEFRLAGTAPPVEPLPARLEVDAEWLALAGGDPATGLVDKYVDPIPLPGAYSASLKDCPILLVADKAATGPGAGIGLAVAASRILASAANVAAVYEDQLGIRLIVQEIILHPADDPLLPDIPWAQGHRDFRDWLKAARPQAASGWLGAAKFGLGLGGGLLGAGYVDAAGRENAVCVMVPQANWYVLAHELGHVLGTRHSLGGLMDSQPNGMVSRTLFTEVTAGETAAKDIFDAAAATLPGSQPLRHPEEIPFAHADARATDPGVPVQFDPLANDDAAVPNGAANALRLAAVGRVSPPGAGDAHVADGEIVFLPAPGFQGTAWFSYALGGDVGNGGRGWLHKGDAAISVGAAGDPHLLRLSPGQALTLFPEGGTGGLTQPAMALAHVSRDDAGQIVVRADPNARGTDTFSVGGALYQIQYEAGPPVAAADSWAHDPRAGAAVLDVLANDALPDLRWRTPVEGGGIQIPPGAALINAVNLTPGLGEMEILRAPIARAGASALAPTGMIAFHPAEGSVGGTARIWYLVEVANGRRASAFAEIILSRGVAEFRRWATPLLGENADPQGDADADGWANLAEFAFGTDPLRAEHDAPFAAVRAPDGSPRLRLRRRAGTQSAAAAEPQWLSPAAGWQTVPPTWIAGQSESGDTTEIELALPAGIGAAIFWLKVELLP